MAGMRVGLGGRGTGCDRYLSNKVVHAESAGNNNRRAAN